MCGECIGYCTDGTYSKVLATTDIQRECIFIHRGFHDFGGLFIWTKFFMNGSPRDSLPIKKKRKKSTQAEKTKFRGTSTWMKFRNRIKLLAHNKDYITGSPLRKGWTLHHMDLDEEHYQDLSDVTHFLACNRKTHDLLHFCYLYYSKDPTFLDRLKEKLDLMVEINKEPEWDIDLEE